MVKKCKFDALKKNGKNVDIIVVKKCEWQCGGQM